MRPPLSVTVRTSAYVVGACDTLGAHESSCAPAGRLCSTVSTVSAGFVVPAWSVTFAFSSRTASCTIAGRPSTNRTTASVRLRAVVDADGAQELAVKERRADAPRQREAETGRCSSPEQRAAGDRAAVPRLFVPHERRHCAGRRGRASSSARNALRSEHAGAAAAERDAGRRREQVVEEQHLDERERLGAVELGADRELAEALSAQVAREVQVLPDRVLDLGPPPGVEIAGHVEVQV